MGIFQAVSMNAVNVERNTRFQNHFQKFIPYISHQLLDEVAPFGENCIKFNFCYSITAVV